MERSSAETKARLLEAATVEFADTGLAGARVDRIAKNARANKQLIYAYFGSKDELFDAVLASHVVGLLDNVVFDPEDLAGYAARLFDFYIHQPHLVRLARWSELERPGVMAATPEAAEATAAKIAALRDAMVMGVIDDSLPPDELLETLLTLTAGAATAASGPSRTRSVEQARSMLQTAVVRLTRR